jgi:hypothetical protein
LGSSGSIFCHCASVSFQRRLVILDSFKKLCSSQVYISACVAKV